MPDLQRAAAVDNLDFPCRAAQRRRSRRQPLCERAPVVDLLMQP